MLHKIGDFKGIDIEVIQGFNNVVYSGLLDEKEYDDLYSFNDDVNALNKYVLILKKKKYEL